MRALFAIGLLLPIMLVPAAEAQGQPLWVDMKAHADPEPLMPEAEVAQVQIEVVVTCPALALSKEPVHLALRLEEAPAYASVSIQPSHQTHSFHPAECKALPSAHRFVAYALVKTNREAPAYKDDRYAVIARVWQDGVLPSEPTEASVVWTIKNDYVPFIQVNAGIRSVEVETGATATIPVDVINKGNGPTRVSLKVEGGEGLAMIAPGAELRLESVYKGAEAQYKGAREVQVAAGNETGPKIFTIRFVASYDGPALAGLMDVVALSFSVIVEEGKAQALAEEETPTVPAPMGAIVALVMLGVAAWRRGSR